MNLTQQQIEAIYILYPQAVTTRGNEVFDANGNAVQYDINLVDTQAGKDACKKQASALLFETDWTTIPDVANPSDSNPYLTNQREFMTWRSEIRQLAVNPVANPVWPTQPTPQWGNKQ
jgi:hypothetical protein